LVLQNDMGSDPMGFDNRNHGGMTRKMIYEV